MSYEVAEGQVLIHSGTRYPAGSIAPTECEAGKLCELGVLVIVAPPKDTARPTPERVPAAARSGFNPSDPATIRTVPLRSLPAVLAGIDDADALKALHQVEVRKGGLDAIEERLGELGVGL